MKYSLNLKACIFACASIVCVGGSWQVMQAMNETKETTEDKNSDIKNCEIKNLLIEKILLPFFDAWDKKDNTLIQQESTKLVPEIEKLNDCSSQTLLMHNPFANVMLTIINSALQQENSAFLYLLDQQEFLKAISIDNIIVCAFVIGGKFLFEKEQPLQEELLQVIHEKLLKRNSIIIYLKANKIEIEGLQNRALFESMATVFSGCFGKPDISDSSHPNELDSDSDSDDGEPFDESEIKDFNKLFIDDKDLE